MRRPLIALALIVLASAIAFALWEPAPEPLAAVEPVVLPPPAPLPVEPVRPRAVTVAVALDAGPASAIELPSEPDASTIALVLPPPPEPIDSGAPVVAAAEAPTFGLDAGKRAPDDPRFTIRWGKTGLCGDEPLERLAERRAALLATFVGVRRANTLILRDPDVPSVFVDGVGEALITARRIILGLLGPRTAEVPFPVVYVYATADQLRGVACVNTATAGYYDGAIHLPASDPDAYRTVVHELVHHVLNALGLRKPMWLHEGLAMYAADERWWEDPRLGLTAWLRGKHLPFPALTEAFPHTADELFAGAAYYQSYQMVTFVGLRGGRPDYSWLVDGVVSGQFTPQGCFGESVGLAEDQLESAWSAFIQSR